MGKLARSVGFEPTRGDPNRFLVCRLNRERLKPLLRLSSASALAMSHARGGQFAGPKPVRGTVGYSSSLCRAVVRPAVERGAICVCAKHAFPCFHVTASSVFILLEYHVRAFALCVPGIPTPISSRPAPKYHPVVHSSHSCKLQTFHLNIPLLKGLLFCCVFDFSFLFR